MMHRYERLEPGALGFGYRCIDCGRVHWSPLAADMGARDGVIVGDARPMPPVGTEWLGEEPDATE